MTLKSMTGFARRDGAYGATRWYWEVRSVNGRGLDIRTRLPPGYEALEARVREGINRHIVRGSLSISLSVQRDAGVSDIRLNEPALASVLSALDRVRRKGDFERPRPEAILALRGVLEVVEPEESEEEREARIAALLASFDTAIRALVNARVEEGARLARILADQIATIERIVGAVAASPARSADAIRARLREQLQRLMDNSATFDEQRIYQEAALLATRADVEEELKRLVAHIAATRDLLQSAEPIGRKLDFLSQEFNREANTLCSKASDVEITRLGLELKAVIDQMREQVQNIE